LTYRLRSSVFDKLDRVHDAQPGRAMTAKCLVYTLRIALAGCIYYKRSDYTSIDEESMLLAKRNLARLHRQIDFYDILPRPEPGVIRTTPSISSTPYFPEIHLERAILQEETQIIRRILRAYDGSYAIYSSMWGVNSEISLPVVNVILEYTDEVLEEKLVKYFGPYIYETFPIRFAKGVAQDLGRIWHYERVPIGASISQAEDIIPPAAGTLGVYVKDADDDTLKYALTAGHVARLDPTYDNVTIYAPASRPFAEAHQTLSVYVTGALKRDDKSAQKTAESALNALRSVDRTFGNIVYTTMETSKESPFLKTDVALVKVLSHRSADNCLHKVDDYSNNVDFEDRADIPLTIKAPSPGTHVAKVGIRTKYTTGVIGTPAYVRWRPTTEETISPSEPAYADYQDSVAHCIYGDEGLFADKGDSGSLVVHFERDDPIGAVKRTHAIGLVHSLVLEEPPMPSVVFFLPLQEALDKVSREIGKRIVLDDRIMPNDEWGYVEHGRGRSMYDLR
jgi:Peptidase family S64